MPRLSPIDKRLASRLEHQRIEALLRAEGIADRIERELDRITRQVLGEVTDDDPTRIGSNLRDAADLMQSMIPTAVAQCDQQFPRMLHWSYRETVHTLARSIPRRWFRLVSPIAIGREEELSPLLDIQTPTEPVAQGERLSDEEWEAFLLDNVFPPPTPERVEEIVYQPVAGKTWQQRFDDLSGRITDPTRMAGTLVSGYSQGMSRAELSRQLAPLVQNIKSSARRIARTEGLRIATLAQREQYQQIDSMMVGVQILATLDENTRPHHAMRNGRVYWHDRRRRPTIDDLPVLPDEPNCRCFDSPVLTPPKELEKDPGLMAEFRNASGDSIPDPAVYTQWFDQVDPGRRKMAVGVKRYNSMQRQLAGQREPRWTDFVDEEGRLLPLQTLRAETPRQREARITRVDKAINERTRLISDVSRFGFVSPPGADPPTPPIPDERGPSPVTRREPRVQKRVLDELGFTASNAVREASHETTKERVSEVRRRLESHDTALESLRQAVLSAPTRGELQRQIDVVRDLERRQAEANRAVVRAIGTGISPDDARRVARETMAEIRAARTRINELRSKVRLEAADAIGEAAEQTTSAVMDLGRTRTQVVKDRAAETQEFLSRMLSEKHSKNPAHGGTELKVKARMVNTRANYNSKERKISVSKHDPTSIYVHEFGHALEEFGEVHELAKGFLYHRVGNEKPQQLSRILKGYAYGSSEFGREDDFGKAFGDSHEWYVGKYYRDHTEIVSMGIEKLFDDPVGFAENDPEYFKFTAGVLNGVLL